MNPYTVPGIWQGLSSVNDGFDPCPVPTGFPSLEKALSGLSSLLYISKYNSW